MCRRRGEGSGLGKHEGLSLLPTMAFRVSEERPCCVPTSQNLSVPGFMLFKFSTASQPASHFQNKDRAGVPPHPRLRPRWQHQRRLLRRRWGVTFLREQIFLGQQTGPAPTASHTPPTALGRGPPAAGEPVLSSATQSSPSMPASSTAGRGPRCSPDLCSVPSKPPG